MPRKRSTPPEHLDHHWYLAEWSKLAGKIQADAQRELGWSKAGASNLWNGKQRYTQDLVDEVARWFQIKPHELLMPPEEAMALRRLRDTAAVIVADQARPFNHEIAPAPPAPPARKRA